MHDTTDHTLIAAYRTGDHEAYAVLVARYEGVVRAACRRQVAGAEIDDCVQAVFLVLARRPASATRVPVLAAWLLRVASYVCRRAQRSAGRRTRAERAAAMISHVNEATSCDALDYLDDCLIRLPERQRVAVSLHYLAGKAPEEVATALGVSRDNAYQLVSRGVARLRILLSRRGVAISGPALLALISAEAQAAEFDTLSTSTIVSALSAAPTDHINHLADGALDTMATPFYIPIAAAAFCAALGITAVFMTQSSGPISSLLKMVALPVVNSIQSYSSGFSESESIASILAKVYTMDFDTKRDSSDIFSFLERATKQKFVSDQGINPAKFPDLNFKVDKLSLKNILGLIERMLHLTHTY